MSMQSILSVPLGQMRRWTDRGFTVDFLCVFLGTVLFDTLGSLATRMIRGGLPYELFGEIAYGRDGCSYIC